MDFKKLIFPCGVYCHCWRAGFLSALTLVAILFVILKGL